MADRLSLANALGDAKIDRATAERIATEIFDVVHDNVAAKQDLERIETALRADIQRIEAALRADIQRLESRTEADLREMELRIEAPIDRVVVRLGSLVVVVAGLLFAAIRYLPPAH